MITQKQFHLSKPTLTVKTSSAYFAGILYTTKRMIENITNNSGTLAKSNEYQVHWEGITFRLSKGDNFLDITVPTVVYNYPQEVSASTIEFDLKDVLTTREAIKPLVDVKAKEVMAIFYKPLIEYATSLGLTVSAITNAMSNIHRHPGGLSSFSGTDYDTNPDNPGIVFPLKSANMASIYSSIIIHKDTPVLTHTEYRVANSKNSVITYYKGSCLTFCKGYTVDVPEVYNTFLTTTTTVPSTTLNDGDTFKSELVKPILDLFENNNYEPDTQCVVASNLKAKTYSASSFHDCDYNLSKGGYTTPTYSTYKSKITPHVGKLPLLATLEAYPSLYDRKLFTTKFGKILGEDAVSLAKELEEDAVEMGQPLPDFKTIEDVVEAADLIGILELYLLEEPKSKAAGGK